MLTNTMQLRHVLVLTFIVACATVLRIAWFNGLYGHDDFAYLLYVRSFLNGDTTEAFQTVHGLRFGVWLPMALLFRLLKPSFYLAFAPGFAQGLMAIVMTYCATAYVTRDHLAAACAAILITFSPVDWMVSTTIRGDIETSFYGALLLVLLLMMVSKSGARCMVLGLLTGVVWGISVLTKEWCYVFAWGFVLVAAYVGILNNGLPWRFAFVLVGFVSVLAVDALVVWCNTGALFGRLTTNIMCYARYALNGDYNNDMSTHFACLPSLLLGLRNRFTEPNRFVNGYPYYSIYYWPLIPSVVWALLRSRNVRIVALWTCGILLWMEFGTSTWQGYFPLHKEPRYLAIISAPAACAMGVFVSAAWQHAREYWRVILGGVLIIYLAMVITTINREHHDYTAGRDYIHALLPWIATHSNETMWVGASLQNELDLRFHYAFHDTIHKHAGLPGHGRLLDACFWSARRVGEYFLLDRHTYHLRDSGEFDPTQWECVGTFTGKTSMACLYRMSSVTNMLQQNAVR